MVWWNGHLIPFQSFFAIPQSLIPYQWYCLCTNTRHTTIPYQSCSRMAVTGWLGSFLQKYQKISVGCYASLLGFIFNRLVLGNFLSILRHQSNPASEIHAANEVFNASSSIPYLCLLSHLKARCYQAAS